MKVIGLDVGSKRIGVARADSATRIAVPVGTLAVDGHEFENLKKLAEKLNTKYFIVGLPRSNQGFETKQSAVSREFAAELEKRIPDIKIKFQDESLTSVLAEERLMKKTDKTGKMYQKGEVDAEAATIILQDFLENLSTTVAAKATRPVVEVKKETPKMKKPRSKKAHKLALKIAVGLLGSIVILGALFFVWYNSSLSPVYDSKLCSTSTADEQCKPVDFTVENGETVAEIASHLESAGIIKSALAFQIYDHFNRNPDQPLRIGDYQFSRASSVEEIYKQLVEGSKSANVFQLTILPGETVKQVKNKLQNLGYSEEEIDAAFSKNYDHKVLSGRGDTGAWGAEPLEGYIFGDTYEFYIGESVENIILTCLDNLLAAVEGNDLIARFGKHDLSLYEGITLASIVQKEAGTLDQPYVAEVFYNRLADGISFGSDVTLTYALNLVDPNRETYQSNADALSLDHPYNTRNPVYTGLTPGPISNPGISALLAVADPKEPEGFDENRRALYFLTGDDGKMYYSSTDAEHNQNIEKYCRELCGVRL
ncbi:endolytic transglycosylase MltG [Candidatus Saccharibacteria bacterium]|nr:endolytic transglycosylase MltG [Candidatus Saccharibacteria bacterium]